MNQAEPEALFGAGALESIPDVHRFSHQAMATTFEAIIQYEDALYAGQAAQAAFDEVDRLEARLSRYVENSDVARLNSLRANTPLPVAIETFECLDLSARMHQQTNGAFDVTIGTVLDCWRDENKQFRVPDDEELAAARRVTGMDLIHLDGSAFTVEVERSGVRVDLGGIGKGYALDRVASLLREWSIERALIHGGYSSVLALDSPFGGGGGWPVTFSDPANRSRRLASLGLVNRAMSGSGVQKGRHIIDPRTGRPAEGKCAGWVCTAQAGPADALSTAFMVMGVEEIARYCQRHRDVSALLIVERQRDGRVCREVLHFGDWTEATWLVNDGTVGE
ncbi:MAG TPA: FAD:protein FMN transferase [Phycisphaerales bacterium]|nr:FAD:protein FMN transferase [Phycisphaerales bacterium]